MWKLSLRVILIGGGLDSRPFGPLDYLCKPIHLYILKLKSWDFWYAQDHSFDSNLIDLFKNSYVPFITNNLNHIDIKIKIGS